MPEEITNEVETTQEVDAPTQEEIEDITNLPSDKSAEEEQQALNDWNALQEKYPDYMKQFKSLDDMVGKYKELHKQYSTTIQRQKESERATLEEQEKIQKYQEAVQEVLPDFMNNGMELTPEIEEKLKETGLDIRDVKLGALELKEKIQKAHSVVGGREEYETMMSWAKENLSEKQKVDFDREVVNPNMSEFAIRGLYSLYKENNSQANTDRIRGNSVPAGVKPYTSQAEVLRDRRFINSGRASASDIAKHKARLDVTDEKIIFGR